MVPHPVRQADPGSPGIRERGDMKAEPRIVKCPSCGTRNRVPAATTGVVRCAKCHADMPWVVDAGENTFDEVVQTSSVPVVVDLWAPWCGPCRTVSPLLEQMAVEYAGRMKLVKVNVDSAPSIQQRFGVQGIPTFVLLSGGEEVGRLVGAQPLAGLRSWFDSTVAGL